MKYDWLIVGAGLFGSVFAFEAGRRGKRVLVIDRRRHIGGNCYTENVDGINVHLYGAHIFRTSKKEIWDYLAQFVEFNHFINSPIANYRGTLYNLPFNMNTFNKLWGVVAPEQAMAKIAEQRKEITGEPRNLEEQAISLVGRDIYEILIKEYTEKQWGRPCSELPKEILSRLPVRFTFDNNYYRDPYQGVPIGGYTRLFEKLLSGCTVRLNEDYLIKRDEYYKLAENILFTGPIDEYYDYRYSSLEYRSLRFEHEKKECPNYQGVAVMNFTDRDTPYTRIIEHKHFEFGNQPFTIISREYSYEWHNGIEPYYPINNDTNQRRFEMYMQEAKKEQKTVFGGRLGTYKYTDMQDTVSDALDLVNRCLR